MKINIKKNILPIIPLGIRAKNCKSFGDTPQGVDAVYPINLIIGKNNSGKSALLDVIHYVTNPQGKGLVGHKGNQPEVFLTKPLTNEEIVNVFPAGTSGGGVPGANFFEFGSAWIDKPLTVRVQHDQQTFERLEPDITTKISEQILSRQGFNQSLAQIFHNPLIGKHFRKLTAERNIHPEVSSGDRVLAEDGAGASNLIQHFLNSASLASRHLVEDNLLNALNKIFFPEAKFDRILTQILDNNHWEVYLHEKEKGTISLSNSGSGLKTIILVLINLVLIPKLENTSLSDYIFAFEELENNLHPSLQRKLLLYIKEIAEKEKSIFFLTTHSNVIIDLFGKDPDAQIIHIKNNGTTASAKKVETYIDNNGILDDLDFRASDLLQSNSVVWLEGPSDRVYFNKWIELWSDGVLKEGVHYQCLFYGGKLLARLSASEEDVEDAVSIMRVNRNCILLMDSDKNLKTSAINKTKKRIKKEVEEMGGMPWVTGGREIENYLPIESLREYFAKPTLKPLDQFVKFPDYLEKHIKKGEGDKFLNNKVLFSQKISPLLNLKALKPILDLDKKMKDVCSKIKEWNKLP